MTTNSPQSHVRQRRTARRRRSSSVTCSPNSSSLSIAQRGSSPQATWRYPARSPRDLAGLRFLVLSHIEDLEKKLEKLGPVPDLQSKSSSEEPASHHSAASPHTSGSDNAENYSSQNSELDFPIEDLRTWVRDSLDQLAHLRSEVSVRLPDLEDIRSHFPDFDFEFELPNINLDDFRARLSRMEVPNLSTSLTDVKSRIGDLGYEYLPALSERLSRLHSQLKSLSLPNSSDFPSRTLDKGNAVLRDFIDALMYNEEDSPLEKTRVDLEVKQTVVQIHEALQSSMNGTRLITYEQL
jgi:exonuclease VII large subunit